MTKHVKGVQKLVRQLQAYPIEKTHAVARGLLKAGLKLQATSQKLVSVDTGALKASAFTEPSMEPEGPKVIVGYTQRYAIYVHEMIHLKHTVGQAKYLEEPFRTMTKVLSDIILKEVKKG
jgi:Flp pilus assembly protein CpaB